MNREALRTILSEEGLLKKRARLRFQKKRVTISIKGEDWPVEAEVVGSWAVHLDTPPPPPPTMPGWVVTFLPTSHRLTWKRSKTEAKRTLEKVLAHVPEVLAAKSLEELRRRDIEIKQALR